MLIKVNAHYEKFDIYCGRYRKDEKWNLEASRLGNPYKHLDERGRSAIEQFRFYLWEKIRARDTAIIDALIEIIEFNKVHGDCRLACWCAPRPCHVDVIIAALQSEAVTFILSEEIYKRGINL